MESIKGSLYNSSAPLVHNAGVFPGLPSLIVRLARKKVKALKHISIGMVAEDNELPEDSARAFLDPRTQEPYLYKDNKWKKVSIISSNKFDFGNTFNSVTCYPFLSRELMELNSIDTLSSLGFYIGTKQRITNFIMILWSLLGLNITSLGLKLGGKLLSFAVKKIGKPP